MKMKFTAAIVLIGILTLGLAACGPGAGGSGAGAAMLDLVPAGDYESVVAIKPAELFNSEFLTNLKESFPLISTTCCRWWPTPTRQNHRAFRSAPHTTPSISSM